MPIRLDSRAPDFAERFRAFLANKREGEADVEAAVRAIIAEVAARGDQALFVRTPHDVGHLDERILQMGGHDFEVVPVKGDELHRLHDARSLPFSALWR